MTWGVDGDRGVLADMTELGIWEPLSVKVQTFKTAIEVGRVGAAAMATTALPWIHITHLPSSSPIQTAILLLRIDDIVSGSKKRKEEEGGGAPPTKED